MSSFEAEYYLLYPSSYAPGVVILEPDEQTSARPFLSDELVPGKPLRFINGFSELVGADAPERIDDLLYDGSTFAIRDGFRELFEAYPIRGLQLYPMIFIDSSGKQHFDYWYMNVYEELDFLDRDASELMAGEDASDPDVFVIRFAFAPGAVAEVPLELRMAFRLHGAANSGFFVHERLYGELLSRGATGFRGFKVSEFSEGMQNLEA